MIFFVTRIRNKIRRYLVIFNYGMLLEIKDIGENFWRKVYYLDIEFGNI